MATRHKHRSVHLDRAHRRASAIGSIADPLTVAPGITLEGYRSVIADARTKLDAYNNLVAQATDMRSQFLSAEVVVRDWSERMLAGVGALYGKNSNAYEQAGGTRKGGVRRQTQEATAAPVEPIETAA